MEGEEEEEEKKEDEEEEVTIKENTWSLTAKFKQTMKKRGNWLQLSQRHYVSFSCAPRKSTFHSLKGEHLLNTQSQNTIYLFTK